MPTLLLSHPLGADDAQRIGLAEVREYIVGERIIVNDFAAQTMVRTGYGLILGDDEVPLVIGGGPPNADIGEDGQWYLDTVSEVLWGPKTGGIWPSDPIRPDRGVARFDLVDHHLVVTYSTGTVHDLGDVRGPANVLTIGDVVTGEPDADADVTITGDAPEQTLHFVLPRGDKGEDGAPGLRGPAGEGYGGGFAVGGTVTDGVIETVIESRWGLRDDGTAYYDPDGALPDEAALLMPDPFSGGWSLFRPGQPVAGLFDDAVAALLADPASAARTALAVGQPNGLATLDAAGKIPLGQMPTGAGGGGGDAGSVVVDDSSGTPELTVVSKWGITADGDPYYDSDGAVPDEAGLLVPDPDTGAWTIWRPGDEPDTNGIAPTPRRLARRDDNGRLHAVEGQDGDEVVVASQLLAFGNLLATEITERKTYDRRTPLLQTANYTVTADDIYRLVIMAAASPLTLTLPTNAVAAIPVGVTIEVCQGGTGTVTIAGATGVNVLGSGGVTSLAGQGSIARLIKTDTDTWRLTGDLSNVTPWTTVPFLGAPYLDTAATAVQYRREGRRVVMRGWARSAQAISGASPVLASPIPAELRPSSQQTMWTFWETAPQVTRFDMRADGQLLCTAGWGSGVYCNFSQAGWPLD